MGTALTVTPWVLAVLGVIGVLYFANKGGKLPTPTGNVTVDAANALADFQAGFSKLGIVQDAKAAIEDVKISGTILAVTTVGHQVSALVADERKANVQTAISTLLTELVAVAAPPAKA